MESKVGKNSQSGEIPRITKQIIELATRLVTLLNHAPTEMQSYADPEQYMRQSNTKKRRTGQSTKRTTRAMSQSPTHDFAAQSNVQSLITTLVTALQDFVCPRPNVSERASSRTPTRASRMASKSPTRGTPSTLKRSKSRQATSPSSNEVAKKSSSKKRRTSRSTTRSPAPGTSNSPSAGSTSSAHNQRHGSGCS